MFLADFHVHSRFSDGKLSVPELVDLFGSRGFGAIAITDHLCEETTLIGKFARYLGRTLTRENFPQYLRVVREEALRAWDQYRMVVIPGFELSKNSPSNDRSAHILAIGATEYIAADGDVPDLARAVRAGGALAVAAHPVSTRKLEKQTYLLWNRRAELANAFDAWEVASGCYLFEEVQASGLPLLANSDFHAPKQITSWKTLFECERHPDAILDAIRRQVLRFHYYRDNSRNDRNWRLLGRAKEKDAAA